MLHQSKAVDGRWGNRFPFTAPVGRGSDAEVRVMRDPEEWLEPLIAIVCLLFVAFLVYTLFTGTPEEQQAVIDLLEAMD